MKNNMTSNELVEHLGVPHHPPIYEDWKEKFEKLLENLIEPSEMRYYDDEVQDIVDDMKSRGFTVLSSLLSNVPYDIRKLEGWNTDLIEVKSVLRTFKYKNEKVST